MANGKLLRKLIRAGAQGDEESFREISEEVIRHERQKKHHLLANDLERILYGESSSPDSAGTQRIRNLVPKDEERGLPLVQIREPVRDLEEIILSDETRAVLESVLLERRRSDLLGSYGLSSIERLLFCGPPGCGKTLAAEVLATELVVPLAIIRLDSVVSSYLGQTASNLRRIFDFISNYEVVALFDEFDALGKKRTDASEHGEVRRVVNAVLQLMDDFRGDSLLIAATNHQQVLDSAIWRRFEDVLFFETPDVEQIRKFLRMKLSGVRRKFDLDDAPIREWFEGMSYADIERVVIRALKEMILRGEEFVEKRHIEYALSREKRRRELSENEDSDF